MPIVIENNGWRPIETAPMDSTMVDLWAEGRYPNCKWMHPDSPEDDEGWCHLDWHATWDDWYWLRIDATPTHWMPLPEPPK